MTDSLAFSCGWTLARAVLLCLLAWPLIVRIEHWIQALPDSRRPAAFAWLLVPFLFPELLVGYTYRSVTVSFPKSAEGLCLGLLLIRIVPVGVVTLLMSPASAISEAANHCRWLIVRANPWSPAEWWQMARCQLHGPVKRALPALGLMGLVAFQEFELAALLQTPSWTDWFIAAQRVGLDQAEMLRQSRWPVLMQLPLLIGILYWLSSQSDTVSVVDQHTNRDASRSSRNLVLAYLALASLFGCLVPIGVLGWNLPSGLSLLVRQTVQWSGLGREILFAIAISVCAGMTSWIASGPRSRSRRPDVAANALFSILLLPGLIGSLLLSLVTVGLFQQAWLRSLYDTPVPWLLALFVWLLPRAVLMRVWVDRATRTESLHLAEMLLARPDKSASASAEFVHSPSRVAHWSALRFRLRDQPQILAMSLLCYWAYLDLSTACLLAPSGMSSELGLVRLYNFMHFGRSAALSAEAFLFFGTPIAMIGILVVVLRLLPWLKQGFTTVAPTHAELPEGRGS